MINIIRADNEKQWLENRKQFIGGSDACTLMGENKYKTLQELWEEKVGIRHLPDLSDNQAIQFGNNMEEYLRGIAKIHLSAYNIIHEPYNIYSNSDYKYFGATYDGLIKSKKDKETKGILEVKTTSVRSTQPLYELLNNGVQEQYKRNAQLQLLCNPKAEFVFFIEYIRVMFGERDFANEIVHDHIVTQTIWRDEIPQEAFNSLIEKGKYISECIRKKERPITTISVGW